jgi:hypothetical protein
MPVHLPTPAQKAKNRMMLIFLLALIALLFAITIVKIKTQS